MDRTVDLYMLTRPGVAIPEDVARHLNAQRGVSIHLHNGIGDPRPEDRSRWDTIARGRNDLKIRGTADWAMFVDDDVVLGAECVRTLLHELQHSSQLGAIAADYRREHFAVDWKGHVSMGACLFRRSTLEAIQFRATREDCECQCCCDDMRQAGLGIAYSRNAFAIHKPQRNLADSHSHAASERSAGSESPIHMETGRKEGVVLAAFDRRDIARFERHFLASLRRWNNRGQVIAVAYGLYPSELQRLAGLPGLQIVPRPFNGEMVPVRRLTDFGDICRGLAVDVPVAYWDVADVIFQSPLEKLWEEVQRNPDHILAVREPNGYPGNAVIPAWSLSIQSPYHREFAYRLLQNFPFLNSGFAAGTAGAMRDYFHAAKGYLCGPELRGTSDWGDQMALNLYCHTNPQKWRETQQGWNYCVHDRPSGEVWVSGDGLVCSQGLGRIPVAHGNARSLRQFSLLS
ncbi:hypothetical protein FF011L_31950 [Roseimaritima multifibrata]|uniref:Uncharacterized protein n=1 Tax=Roseimaritima multifibrata TaxID=1930274 RepID=A0A517MHQ4_9BACT|nr:glycosyltransferase family 2 protein [Roseimaritima multifibrata]QDS94416.1 hypothetical protein FF011L_31950 [Roseimaritima multifibrata]